MLYRPNFCCSCGEKIDRIEWHVWTSRRFCELCQSEHQLDDWTPRVLGGFLLFTGLFGLGSLLGGSGRSADLTHSPVRMAVERAERIAQDPPKAEPAPVRDESLKTVPQPAAEPEVLKQARRPQRTEAVRPPVFICGAATKKGTACTRRVKGGGRCWQHTGMEAILPEEDLAVPTGN